LSDYPFDFIKIDVIQKKAIINR